MKIFLFSLFAILFSLENPIYFPQYGDSLKTDSTYTITWDKNFFQSKLLEIFYSPDDGNSWKPISSKIINDGLYEWYLSKENDYFPDYKFRSEGLNSLIGIMEEGDSSTFVIGEGSFVVYELIPELRILSRLYNKKFSSDESIEIEWHSKYLKSKYITLSFSNDDGNNWTILKKKIKDEKFTSLNLPVLENTNNKCRIKINDYKKTDTYFISQRFTLRGKPEIELLYPNSNTSFNGYDILNINWKSKNLSQNRVDIYISMNSGKDWEIIKKGVRDVGDYSFKLPAINSDQCMIKVESSLDGGIYDSSEFSFEIKSKPKLDILSDYIDQIWYRGDTISVNWESKYTPSDSNVDILFSINNKKTWQLISTVKNSGNAVILVPNIKRSSSKSRIKLQLSNNNRIYSINQNNFTIIGMPGLQIIKPDNRVDIVMNTYEKITWKHINIKNKLANLSYSIDNENWIYIDQVDLSDNSYNWLVPEFSNKIDKASIKIENLEIVNILEKSFSIKLPPPEIVLLYPSGNEEFLTEEFIDIQWKTKYLPVNSKILIEFSIDDGQSWQRINDDIENIGKYHWHIPGIKYYSDKCYLRLSSYNDKKYFTKNKSPFTIELKPVIDMKVMNFKKEYFADDIVNISWTAKNITSGKIKIEYSIDNGKSWKNISSNNNLIGNYKWKIPSNRKKYNQCYIKASLIGQQGINNISKIFTIYNTFDIDIYNPEAGSTINYNTGVYINWNSDKKSSYRIDIYYSIDNGKNWDFITTENSSKGSYLWRVPNLKKNYKKCKLKILYNKSSKLASYYKGTFQLIK